MLRLVYLPTNAAWAFRFYASLVSLAHEPKLFGSRDAAVTAAERLGLRVARNGMCSVA